MKKSIFSLFDRPKQFFVELWKNSGTHTDARKVHGFYRLTTPSGRLIGYRHHCPVSGDWEVTGQKGAVVVHCPTRIRAVFDPDVPMPTVVRYPAPMHGVASLPNGDHALMMDDKESDGDFEYEPYDPGSGGSFNNPL